MQVSRETESVADGVVAWFGAGAPLAVRYVDMLTTDGVRRGLMGPREVPRIWSRHILNCAVIHPLLAPGTTVCGHRLGRGPAGDRARDRSARPPVTLVEPLLRRTTFLDERSGRARATERDRAAGPSRRPRRHRDVRLCRGAGGRAAGPPGPLGLPLCDQAASCWRSKASSARDELSSAGGTLGPDAGGTGRRSRRVESVSWSRRRPWFGYSQTRRPQPREAAGDAVDDRSGAGLARQHHG